MWYVPLFFLVLSCSSGPGEFSHQTVCSKDSMNYLRHPKNKEKDQHLSEALLNELAKTQQSMQLCYEDFKNRTGHEEFDTCLVVGVDGKGRTEYFNFSARAAPLDRRFLNCARAVTKSIPYGRYGRNYILVQSYRFYNE